MRIRAVVLVAAFASAPALAAETWVEVKSQNFTAVGDAGERETRLAAWRFEQIRSAFTHMIPELRVHARKPVVLIAAKNEKTLRTLAPEFWERDEDSNTFSVSTSGAERHFVALRTDGDADQTSRSAYWQYAQVLTNASFDSPPLWLREGLGDFYQSTVVEQDRVTVGQPTARQIAILRERALMPIPELLAVKRDSPWFTDPTRREIFGAQAWVLVHYYMFGNKGANSGKLRDLTRRLSAGAAPDEAVRQALGDPREIAAQLQAYVRAFQFPMWRKPADVDVPDRKTYAVRTLAEAEALAWQAEFHVAMNRPVEARQLLEQAEKLEPKSSRVAEVFALLVASETKAADIKAWAAKAVERDPSNAVAQWLLGQQLANAGDAGAEAVLGKVVELRPDHGEAHARLAHILVRAGKDLPRALELARRAVELDPARAWHHLVLAHVSQASGKRADALASLARARSVARAWDQKSLAEYTRWLESAQP